MGWSDLLNGYSFLINIKVPCSILFALIFFFIVSTIVIAQSKRSIEEKIKDIGMFAAFFYIIFLFCQTVIFRDTKTEMEFKFIPFWSYIEIIQFKKKVLVYENILNVILFIPLGFFLGFSQGSGKWKTALAIGGAVSFLIEISQLLFRRGLCEFDDLFHNLIGCFIGYALSLLILIYVQKRKGFSKVS